MTQTIIVAGALAQTIRNGGLTWCFLQLLTGFKRLSATVLFLDRFEQAMFASPKDAAMSEDLRRSLEVVHQFDLDDDYSLDYCLGENHICLPRSQVLELARRADLLLNVMGYLHDEEILHCVGRRIFIDIDPGFGQMWRELGLHDAFRGHTDYVTLGRNIGRPDCTIPTCGLNWITMPQPVVLEHWPVQPPRPEGAFTSIGAWRGPNGPLEYQGHTYGLRVHEFRKFAELPQHCPGTPFEQALDIHPADEKDIRLLHDNGWNLVNPKAVASTPADYRSYIANSKAEFMVPKQMYVDTRSGLLSDRSCYYLASGRPVLARDTGIQELYPTGKGLLTFSTLDEAVAGVEEINGNYARHCKAAREIAEEYFDSDKVLTKLLADLGV